MVNGISWLLSAAMCNLRVWVAARVFFEKYTRIPRFDILSHGLAFCLSRKSYKHCCLLLRLPLMPHAALLSGMPDRSAGHFDSCSARLRPIRLSGRARPFCGFVRPCCQKIASKTTKSTVWGRSGWSRSCFRPRASSAIWCFVGSCLLWRPRASSFACSTCPEPLILAFSRRKNDKMVGRRHK